MCLETMSQIPGKSYCVSWKTSGQLVEEPYLWFSCEEVSSTCPILHLSFTSLISKLQASFFTILQIHFSSKTLDFQKLVSHSLLV